ncbi:MAG: tripartite tricarboxylate transporter substrate binding protein [Burkholderiales bacterium]|nr:tripartite tricarboxylate transporter substrate binding protein [Burkholderiales bacterium]
MPEPGEIASGPQFPATERRLRKRRLPVLALAVAAATPVAVAQAPDYPAKPVRIIVPMAAGSPMELPLRTIGQVFQEMTGHALVVDSRPGASGTIGIDSVAKAPRDGYTGLFFSCTFATNKYSYKKLPFDPEKDLQPVSLVDETYGNMLMVHPSVPARTLKEFIALARSRPGQLNYASAGLGSASHTATALLALRAGIQLAHVPYKGTSIAVNDLVSGYVQLMVASPTAIAPYVRSGRLRALGIGGPRRTPILPEVPTLEEAGLSGAESTCWHGLWFPAGTPANVTRRLQGVVTGATGRQDVRKRFEDFGYIPVGSTPDEFSAFLTKAFAHAGEVATAVGIKPQ